MSIDVNAPDIISLSEVYISFPVYYTDGDNEGEPTGKRERVQVTHIREDPDGDVDDDGYMVDATTWYIARAVRVASGEEIPETELNNMGPITSACRNEQWLTADDEDNLADCIRDRVDTIRQSQAGY